MNVCLYDVKQIKIKTNKVDDEEIHALFFIRILFIRIIRLRSGKNKNNLRIIKAQILP